VLVESVLSCLAALRVYFQPRGDTALEILALSQQLAVLKRANRPKAVLPHKVLEIWSSNSDPPQYSGYLLIGPVVSGAEQA
jgi:hypothetical protein